MANQKREDKNWFGSMVRKSVIGAPLAYGFDKSYQGFKSAGGLSIFSSVVSNKPIVNAQTAAIRSIVFNPANTPMVAPFSNFGLERIGQLGERVKTRLEEDLVLPTPLSKEQVLSTWRDAADAAGMPLEAREAVAQRLEASSTGQQAIENFFFAVQENTSIYTQRASNIFTANIETLDRAASAGLETTMKDIGLTGSRLRRLTGKEWQLTSTTDAFFAEQIHKIKAGLGGAEVKAMEYGRKDIPGSELRLTFTGGKLGKARLELKVPRVLPGDPNLIIHGATQQSKYIAGQYALMEGTRIRSTINHEQYVVYRAAEDLVPAILNQKRINQSAVNRVTSDFHISMIEAPWNVPNTAFGVHPGTDLFVEANKNILRLFPSGPGKYDPGTGFSYPQMSEFDYAEVIKAQELGGRSIYPGFGPSQVARNIVATSDPRAGHLFPEAFPWSRRPIQAIRPEYTPTERALAAMERNAINTDFYWANYDRSVMSPMAKTLFVSEKHAAKLAELGMGTQGGIFISKSLAAQREVEELVSYQVQSKSLGSKIEELLGGKTTFSGDVRLKAGTILGTDPSGRLVELPSDISLKQMVGFSDEGKGNFVQIYGTRNVGEVEWSKVFGFKGMARSVNILGTETFGDVGIKGIQAMVSGGELKKNKALLYHQLFTSLWDFTRTNMAGGKQVSQIASNFAQHPAQVVASIARAAKDGDLYKDEVVVREAFQLARAANLTPEQMGRTFGLVPDVFGLKDKGMFTKKGDWFGYSEDWTRMMMKAEGKSEAFIEKALSVPVSRGFWVRKYGLSPLEYKEISRGLAYGVSQMPFGGEPGPGGLATIEPRLMEMLQSPHFGQSGSLLYGEIADRMAFLHGNRMVEQDIIGKSLKSMLYPGRIEGSISPSAIKDELWKSGFNVKVGGIGDINVPGNIYLSNLAEYKTASGELVKPDLAGDYRSFVEMASDYEAGKIGKEEMRGALSELIGRTTRAYTGTVTGKGGLARGTVLGSTYLTPVLDPQYLGPGEVGITKRTAERMFRDLRGMYTGQAEELAYLESAFFKGESSVPIATWRHPVISPYSLQVRNARLIPGEQDIIAFNEMEESAILASADASEAELRKLSTAARHIEKKQIKQGLIEGGFEVIDAIRRSPAVGMAADYDKDIVGAMLLSPSVSWQIQQQDEREYVQYSIRQQLLKGKAKAGEALTLAEMAADEALKMGIPQRGRLGQLSIALGGARAAILNQQKQLGYQRTINALGVFDYLEQSVVGSKHIAPGKSEQMIDLFSDVIGAWREGKGSEFMRAAESMVRTEKPSLRQGLMGKGINVVTGSGGAEFISGFDLPQATQDIMGSREEFMNKGVSGLSAQRGRDIIFGRGKMATAEEARLLLQEGLEASSLGGFLNKIEGQSGGLMSGLSKRVMTLKNSAMVAGRKALPFAKPLAIGFAASLALSAALSQPPISMSPEAMAPPRPDMKSGTGGANMPTNIHPDAHINGAPTPPPSIPPGHAYIAPANGALVSIRGRSSGRTDYGNMNRQINTVFNRRGNTRTTSSVYDDRTTLTPQKLSDLIKRG